MPPRSIFELPELVQGTAVHLQKRDLARWSATCRLLHDQVNPLLWYDFIRIQHNDSDEGEKDDDKDKESIYSQALWRKRYYVREVMVDTCADLYLAALANGRPQDTKAFDDTAVSTTLTRPLDDGPVTGLKRLWVKIWTGHDHEPLEDIPALASSVLTLLEHNPDLADLSLPAEILFLPKFTRHLSNLLLLLVREGRLPRLERFIWTMSAVKQRVRLQDATLILSILLQIPTLVEARCMFAIEYFKEEDTAFALTYDPQWRPFLFSSQRSLSPEVVAFAEAAPRPEILSLQSKSIKKFHLPWTGAGISTRVFSKILQHCVPNLQDFRFPSIMPFYTQQMGTALGWGCSRVQHLWADYESRAACDDYANLIRGIAPGRIVPSGGVGVELGEDEDAGTEAVCLGLKSFHAENFKHCTAIVAALIEHGTTLEDLFMAECKYLESEDIQGLMSSCTALKKLSIIDQSGLDSTLQFRDIMSSSWVCLGLTALNLTLGRCLTDDWRNDSDGYLYEDDTEDDDDDVGEGDEEGDDEGDDDGDNPEEEDQYFHSDDEGVRNRIRRQEDRMAALEVYRQIGQLTQLRELGLSFDITQFYYSDSEAKEGKDPAKRWAGDRDMTLSGGLKHLAGLTRLEHLILERGMTTRVGQAEIAFMDRAWPKLERITVGFGVLNHVVKRECGREDERLWRQVKERNQIAAQMEGPSKHCQPWSWLQEQRPRLVVHDIP